MSTRFTYLRGILLRISTRTDLIEFIRSTAPLKAVRRAMDDGGYEVLGGFAALPPHVLPGFIVKVTSKHGKVWPVAVAINEHKHQYEVYILDNIPWSMWDGGTLPIYRGDNPTMSQRKRDLARKQK